MTGSWRVDEPGSVSVPAGKWSDPAGDPQPYADPAFSPFMVVCGADRNRNDMRTWEVFKPEDAGPGEWLFDQLWAAPFTRWDTRADLPSRLAVVDGCGFARDRPDSVRAGRGARPAIGGCR